MDLFSFIRIVDPTKVRIGKRQRDEDKPKLLETTVRRVVSLLPVSLDRSSGELEASVKKLFGDGGSVIDPTFASRAVQNAEVRGGVIPTSPFVSSSVSTTPERGGGDHTDLLAGANLRAIRAPQRFIISSDSSDHSGVNIVEAEVDSVVRTPMPIITIATTTTPTADTVVVAKEKLVGSSVFGVDSSFAGGSHPIPGGFSDCSGSDFLIGGIRTVIDPYSNLQKVYVPQWNVKNGFCLDDSGVCQETVRIRAEYNIKERRRLNSVVEEKDSLLKSSGLEIQVTDLAASVKVREQEVVDLDVVVTSVKLQNDSLADQFDKLCADFVEMALHLEDKFYPHLLTTIFGRRCLLTHGMELAISKCLNSTEYLCALGTTIGKAIEKGMQEGLSAGITHGAEGRKLTDVAMYNSSADADYASVETIMSLLRLEDALAERLGLVESQPHVDQLKVSIHHSPDQRTEGTSGAAPDTTIALSVTSVSASTIPPISTDDYEFAHTDGQEGTRAGVETIADESVVPFPHVSDIRLNILE
nr:hypothetical protein [Tanacetum cinerariifolium]